MHLSRRLALSGDVDFLGENGALAFELIQRLVGLLAQKLLGSVFVTVQAVEANAAGFLADGVAARLALENRLGGKADLVLVVFSQLELVEGFFRILLVFVGRVRQTVGHAAVVGTSFGALDDLVAEGSAGFTHAFVLLVVTLLLLLLFLLTVVLGTLVTSGEFEIFFVLARAARLELRVSGNRFVLRLALLTVVVLTVLALTIGNNVRFSEIISLSEDAALGGDKFVLGFSVEGAAETAHLALVEVRDLDASILTIENNINTMSGSLDVDVVTGLGDVNQGIGSARGLLARVSDQGFIVAKLVLFTVDGDFVSFHVGALGGNLDGVLQELDFNEDAVGRARLGGLGTRDEDSEKTVGGAVTGSEVSALTHFSLKVTLLKVLMYLPPEISQEAGS